MTSIGRIAFVLLAFASFASAQTTRPTTAPADYTFATPTRDGIGKIYLGREIAHVMGHLAADWLDRDDRQAEERTDVLLDNLGLKPTDVVADVGAGTGYFSFRIAPRVPRGKVIAEDIQPEMLTIVARTAADRKVTNVEPLLGTTSDPKLPAGKVDVVLLVDAYHEFDQPREMMTAIAASLSPTGRVVLVEYRGEDDNVPIKPLHKMTEAQAVKELAAVGLAHVETKEVLPWQHLMIFKKSS